MSGSIRTAAVALLATLMALPASAQHIASPAAVRDVVAQTERAEAADRAAVLGALERDDVQRVAARLGLDVADARSAVNALEGPELTTLATHAQDLANADVGGQSVTISLTVLLLVLILIAVIAS